MQTLIVIAAGAYLLAFVASFPRARGAVALATAGLITHAIAIVLRWRDLGHGPYLGLHDSLSSNLWIQLVLFLLLAAAYPPLRRARTAALGLNALYAVWLALAPDTPVALPPTFDTGWFYAHVYTGKLGFALLFVAVVVALTPSPRHEYIGNRLMFAAFTCYTAMLLSGAAWGYAAWGGYWDWNALEVWTLLTWFGFGLAFHWHSPLARGAVHPRLTIAVYALAVLTFYGVPFLSQTTHQGLV